MISPSCASVQGLVPDAVSGDLDETARAHVFRHAGDCAECARALDWQERLQAAIAAAPLAEAPALYYESVLAEVHRRLPASAPRRWTERRRITREAISTFFVAALLCLWFGAHVAPAMPWDEIQSPLRKRAASASREAQLAAASRADLAPVVLVEGLGFVSTESAIWDLPEDFLREILPVLPAMLP